MTTPHFVDLQFMPEVIRSGENWFAYKSRSLFFIDYYREQRGYRKWAFRKNLTLNLASLVWWDVLNYAEQRHFDYSTGDRWTPV